MKGARGGEAGGGDFFAEKILPLYPLRPSSVMGLERKYLLDDGALSIYNMCQGDDFCACDNNSKRRFRKAYSEGD